MTTTPASNSTALVEKLLNAKRILFVGGHPDDIEFYCGGLVSYLRRAGVEVCFLIGTRGGKGIQGRAGERLKEIRSAHQMRAADILGGVEVILLDYPDKMLSHYIEPFANDIGTYIKIAEPDFAFFWDPENIYNSHPDHQAAADASKLAMQGLQTRQIYYGTKSPDLYIGLDSKAMACKVRSLRAHRTETPWYYWIIVGTRLRRKLEQDGSGIECEFAEVFRCEPA